MNYPYANGVISAIEGRLFTPVQFARLQELEEREFLQLLSELGYGHKAGTLREMIELELGSLRELIDEITPDRLITDLFFIEADAVNIKVILKQKLYGARNTAFLTGGNIKPQYLKEAVFDDNYGHIPKDAVALFKNIFAKAIQSTDARTLSIDVDKSIYRHVFSSLPLLVHAALKKYFRLSVDTKNILMFARTRALGWEAARFREMFLENGLIDIFKYEELYEKPDDAAVFNGFYDGKIIPFLKRYYKSGDIDALERGFSQLIIDVMKEHRFDSFGIGPIIYYYIAKRAEADNILMLYADKKTALADLLSY